MSKTSKKTSGLSTDKNWWRQAAIYPIYPRSFADSNGDGKIWVTTVDSVVRIRTNERGHDAL